MAVTPDGQHIVSASDDRTVRVWHLATGAEQAAFDCDERLDSLALAPDGATIVAGGQTGRLHYLRLVQ